MNPKGFLRRVRFNHISVLTLRIRADRHEQKSVDPDQQNAASDHGLFATHKTFTVVKWTY